MWSKNVFNKSLAALALLIVMAFAGMATYAQDPSGRPSGTRKPPAKKPPAKVEPQVMTVILTVLTDPPQSAVYINGERRGLTNADGRIQFEKLPLGHYSVEVRKEGFHPMLRGFEAGSEAPTLVFKLEPNLEDYLKEFDSLVAAGKLTGPDAPNALELIERLSHKYPGRPEADRLRGVLAAKLSELVAPVINHSVTDWRNVSRAELVQAMDGAVNASIVRKDDVRYQADAAYLRGVLALRDWQAAGRVQGGSSGAGGDLLATARTELEKANSLNDAYAAARLYLGVVLLNSSDWAGAEAAFIKTAQLEPQWASSRTGLGAVYQAQNKYNEAIDAYRKAIELDPKSGTAFAGLGLARWSKGEKDGVKEIERAVQVDPSCAVAHLNLGIIYAQSKNKKEAARAEGEFKMAIQLNPNNVEFANSAVEQRIADLKTKKKK